MMRPQGRVLAWLALWAMLVTGCQPRHPWYLTRNDDLATYIDAATELAYPDVKYTPLDETAMAHAPLTLTRPEFETFWDLTLQEALNVSLHNSKVIRTAGSVRSPGVPDALIAQPQAVGTIYDPAVIESDPNLGVEAALAAFDAQFASSLFWNTTDRPQNRVTGMALPGDDDFVFFPTVLTRNAATFTAEISKRSATGTQFFFRNITEYDRSNAGGGFQAVPSFYTTQFETEVRQPLLRGNGTRVNRVPILLARIRTDVTLAEFEANVRNLVQDVENAYWDLHCAYRILDTAKAGRDATLVAWRVFYFQAAGGVVARQVEAQARQQYYSFRAQTETALNDLYNAETNLRWLMGLTASDGRLIRPVDEPTTARVEFDWHLASSEALVRSPELRRIKWFIKQRELEQITARNRLLPDLNAVALYRWVGVGDDLINSDRNGLNFPMPGSTAFDVLTEGQFEEARVGFDFAFPIGFRREYAQVRNAQLNLAREHARLEDAELNVSNALAQALRNMDAQYNFAQSYYNAFIAGSDEVESLLALFRAGSATPDVALQAIQRRANSENLFYRALCDYNKSIAFVHFRKNSLLEYNGVFLAEGPWPAKAYFDAEGHARRRAASFYLDYGRTEPGPVSVGPAPRGVIGAEAPPGFIPSPAEAGSPPGELIPTPEPLQGQLPTPAVHAEPEPVDVAPPSPPGGFNPAAALPPRSGLRTTGAVAAAGYNPYYAGTGMNATTYPSFRDSPASAMSYRGLGVAPLGTHPSFEPTPALPRPSAAPPLGASSRREVEPAAYLMPVEQNPVAPVRRLPPTSVTSGP